MNEGRRKTDEFLYKTRTLIADDDYVLELGTGVNNFLSVMFADHKHFFPTDKDIYPGCVPGISKLDAEDFDSSLLIQGQYHWNAIFFCESLEHCPHPWVVFQEVFNHLAFYGLFVVTAPCYYPVHEGFACDAVYVYDYWRFTVSGLAQLFHDGGFSSYYIEALYHREVAVPTGVGTIIEDNTKPHSVVGWGIKGDRRGGQHRQSEWIRSLPDDWVEKHKAAEAEWLRREGCDNARDK